MVEELRDKYSSGWSKEYREMKLEKLCKELVEYMKNYSFIEINHSYNELRIMPLSGKIMKGNIPKDFINPSEGRENQ